MRVIQEDLEEILQESVPWERFSGCEVLITGANGFIGAYLVETLLAANQRWKLGLEITALCRSESLARERFRRNLERGDPLRLLIQDVCDPVSSAKQYRYIIHAASQASPRFYGVDPVGTALPNIVGTRELLELARRVGCERFLFVSSSEVYGTFEVGEASIRESNFGSLDPLVVRSCYAESKRMGETLCSAFHQQYQVPFVVVRPFHTYGPGLKKGDGRVYADFCESIQEGRDLELSSDGSAVRSFCYIADAVRAIFRVLLCGAVGEAYNVGNDLEVCSVRELADRLVAAFPEKRVVVRARNTSGSAGYLPSAVSRNYPDLTKLRRLGWRPLHSIEAGFRRTVESWDDCS